MKAVVAAFNQEKALVGAFSVITNLRMELFEALVCTVYRTPARRNTAAASPAQRAELWRPSYPRTTPRVARSGHSEARWDSRPWVTCNTARREYYLILTDAE